MKKNGLITGIVMIVVFFGFLPGIFADSLEKGTVTGNIERVDEKFLRDYEKLDYKGAGKWEQWGKGLKSLGWIVVQGDSGKLKDYILVVIDTNTNIQKSDGNEGTFFELKPNNRVVVSYRMGWDALHALEIKELN